MIRVVLADDEELLRTALAALLALEADIEVVAVAASATEAVEVAVLERPHVCVFDLEMPPSDGLAAAVEVLAQIETRVIIVTRHARPGNLTRALAAGVSGFAPKSLSAERLAGVIREVNAGRRYVDAEITASALTAAQSPLTDRELDVLRVARAGGSVTQIASELHLAVGTVRNYLSAAMIKLDAQTRFEAATKAWDQGWI